MRSGRFFLIKMAAAPTFPPCAEPSEYTCISSLAFAASRTEASLSGRMMIWNGRMPVLDGLCADEGIFSTFLASTLYILARLCIGPLCLLVVDVTFQLTVLNSGCSGGSAAILVYAL